MEINPPRSGSARAAGDRFRGRLTGIDLLNVTDCALAKLRCAAIPFAAKVKEQFGIPVAVNMSCRDRNIIALQADLLGAHLLGIDAVVALTGDAVTTGDFPAAKGVFEVNSIGLLNLLTKLNRGVDGHEQPLGEGIAIRPGVVANPTARNVAAEVRRLGKKVAAGATFVLTQPVFDEQQAGEFLSALGETPIDVYLGLFPVKTAQGARAMSRIPGLRLSPRLESELAGLPDDADVSRLFVTHALDIVAATWGKVRGYHVVGGPHPSLGLELAQEIVRYRQHR